jgi:MFS family permease
MVIRMVGNRRRWRILALGMAAQASSCVFLYGLPYLLPELRRGYHLSLGEASVLVSCPLIGVVLALIAWGAAADRYGERLIISSGLVIAAGALTGAGYPASFWSTALFPLAAALTVPRRETSVESVAVAADSTDVSVEPTS